MRKTIKILATFLALILAISMLPMSVMATETTGDTVNTDPSAISTPEQFMAMAADGNYYLTNDIDFSNTTITNTYLVENFYGTLNGNGYTLKGIKLNYTATEETASADVHAAVFGSLANGSYSTAISNLKIDGITITVDDSVTAIANSKPMAIAFLAARLNDGRKVTVDNVHVTNGTIDATLGNRWANIIGGIVADGGYTGLSVSNSSVSGKIEATANYIAPTEEGGTATSANAYVGGALGFIRTQPSDKAVINNFVNNADITVSYDQGQTPTSASAMGGIAGKIYMALTVTNCENNGTLTTSMINGGIVGFDDTTQIVVVADCNTKSGNIYGKAKSSARLCVAGCTVGDTEKVASTQNTTMTAITQASDFSQLDNSTGFFYLANDIDFANEEAAKSVVNSFSGVLYGNGKTIKNLKLDNAGDMGFFYNTASTAHTVIVNMNIGTPDAPATLTTGAAKARVGTLIRRTGVLADESNVSGYWTTVSGVDIYADITAAGNNVGGFVALAQDFSCYDSNFYGSISVPNNTTKAYVAGFVGYGAYANVGGSGISSSYRVRYELTLVGCSNYADIITDNSVKYISGFIGADLSRTTLIIDCKNYGDIINATGNAAAFQVEASDWGCFIISNCQNFANIKGSMSGTAIAVSNHENGYVRVNGVVDYGTLTVTGTTAAAGRFVGAVGSKDTVVGCFAESVIEMQNGAAIRIDPAVTGLRYKANLSEDVLAKFINTFGEDAVSYGTIIAPEAFVIAAGGDFTVSAMETLENETRKDLFADKGVDAYVNVPATEWFVGENGVEENVIAGSIVNMSGLYGDRFVGRSYVKIDVTENKTVYIYADYFDGNVENNTRTVKDITKAAVNDLLYKTGDRYYRIEEGKEPVEVTDAALIAEYTTNVGTEGEYTKLSCYSSENYGDLTDLWNLINK